MIDQLVGTVHMFDVVFMWVGACLVAATIILLITAVVVRLCESWRDGA